MRVPKDVLDELEDVRLYTRTHTVDIPLLRYLAMERGKAALVHPRCMHLVTRLDGYSSSWMVAGALGPAVALDGPSLHL